MFTDTIRTTLNSFSTLIRQDLIIGRIVIMIGDDNSDCFKGTWNTDFSVKTVTRATGSIASPISACDLVFFAQNNLQNDSSTGVYYSNGKIGVISAVTNNFKPSIDKPIPTLVYYNYRNFSNPSYYYWYQNRSVLTNLSVLNGTYNFTFDFDYLGKHYSIKKRMIISYQFTDTITSKATQLLSNSISTNLAIQNQETFTFKALDPGSNQVVGYSKSYIFTKKLRASFKYAKHIIVKFSGTANDYATINLNLGGNNYNYQSNASYYFAGCYSSIKPDGSFVDFVNYNLDQNINFNNNQVNVKITQHGTCALWTDISVQGSILVQYKQFTDTVKTSVSTFSANLNNKIQLVNIYTIKGNNVAECHVFELVEIWKLLYTLNISVKSKDVEKAYITATLTAEGDDEFIFKLNDSLNMSLPVNAGSCKTCSACGNYTNFYKNSTRTFDVTQYLQDTNSIYVYFHNFTGGYSFKISNLEFTIKTYSKLQFTDTIRANFDNFNSKLSIPINIKNYDDINISKVENYYCNGNSLTFQPHIYNYKIAYWRVVKSIEIEISGQSDDYAQVIVNNSITVHPNLQDTLGIKDGIYIWGKTQSSDYVKEKHPFTMTNENLNIQFGTVNTLPTVCYLKASLKIRLFFQFTDTVTPTLKSLGSFNNSLKIVLKTVFTTRISNIISDTGRCEGYCYWEYDVVSLNASILSNPENYAKAVAEFSIYGKADDGFKFYLNGTNITTFASVCNHGSCTSKSDWLPSLHSFEYSLTSKTNNLLIKAYSIKNDYWAEIYSAILMIKTESKQFTDTINTVNPDCNVKAETKYQSVNITLPFNLVISPQDRWCEIHLSRVDYITTVSGGFPNTAVRVDFTSSSGHDPNYSNRIMHFDANGNLTFSNFCTQQSHSGSVDTWNITYMGKHYHFTIHWYW